MKFIIYIKAAIFVYFHTGSQVVTEEKNISVMRRGKYVTKNIITYIAVTKGSLSRGNLKVLKVFFGKAKIVQAVFTRPLATRDYVS